MLNIFWLLSNFELHWVTRTVGMLIYTIGNRSSSHALCMYAKIALFLSFSFTLVSQVYISTPFVSINPKGYFTERKRKWTKISFCVLTPHFTESCASWTCACHSVFKGNVIRKKEVIHLNWRRSNKEMLCINSGNTKREVEKKEYVEVHKKPSRSSVRYVPAHKILSERGWVNEGRAFLFKAF